MEGAGFYEPLHQESFMKELQSLSKLVYTTAAVVCLMDGLLLQIQAQEYTQSSSSQ